MVANPTSRLETLPRPRLCYLEIPAIDIGESVRFYENVFGWKIRHGKSGRPSFDDAAPPEAARALYESVVRELRTAQLPVATGEFQAMMRVELVNDGPVTILIDSKRQF